jgi:hypothetical protein
MLERGPLDWTEGLALLHRFIAIEKGWESPIPPDHELVTAFLEDLSRKAGHRTPASLGDWLQPAAIESLLVQKIANFDPRRGRFAAWCYVVVRNDAISKLRRLDKDALGHASTGQSGEKTADRLEFLESPERGALVEERFNEEINRIRGTLDGLATIPGREIDYFAVFLVQLRWTISERLRKSLADWDLAVLGQRSELVEYCLPWNENESQRRFKQDWPAIGGIWKAMGVAMDRSDRPFSFDQFQKLLEASCDQAGNLTADLWHHWTKRAKVEARKHVPPEDWDRSFGRWFPDRGRAHRRED